jgi:hypothetical protein
MLRLSQSQSCRFLIHDVFTGLFMTYSPGYSWRITGCVTSVKRQVPHVEQEVLILQDHMTSSPVFIGVRVDWSLVFYVLFCRSLFVLLSFDHCIVCTSSIYGFWLSLWYLQAILCMYFETFVWYIKRKLETERIKGY